MFPTKVKADTAVVDHDAVNDNLALAAKAALDLQFKTAQGYIKLLLTQIPGLRPALRTYNNTLTSITEGIADGALTRAGAKVECKQANDELETAVSKVLKGLTEPSPFDPEALYKDLDTSTLKVYDTNMNQVQVQLNKHGIFTGYVPIVPVTKPSLDTAKLKAHGIAADNFAGYSILKKEFVAGITHDKLKLLENAPDAKGKNKVISEKAAIKEFEALVLSKYKGLHLELMAEPTGWWGAMWFWFGTKKEFEVLKHCTLSTGASESLKMIGWSFPFNRK